MMAFGLVVLGEAAYKAMHPLLPGVQTMGMIGGWRWRAISVAF
jgi:hypothetical protein